MSFPTHTQNWNPGLTGLALGVCVCVGGEGRKREVGQARNLWDFRLAAAPVLLCCATYPVFSASQFLAIRPILRRVVPVHPLSDHRARSTRIHALAIPWPRCHLTFFPST